MNDITINPESPIKKIEEKIIIDIRTFLPHQIKESEEWNWRKMKNEKWFVQLDCHTGKLKKWKLKEDTSYIVAHVEPGD